MEAVAVLVGLFGLSSSLGAIVLARRREFGVLRHLGLTRSQIRGMLAAEGGLLALVGSAAGLAAGAAISLVLVYVVNRQRSEEHTSELQSLMRISYAVFCLKKKNYQNQP